MNLKEHSSVQYEPSKPLFTSYKEILKTMSITLIYIAIKKTKT